MSATATAVRERPILFSGPMVRAILDGRKTVTRRVYKPAPGFPHQDGEVTGNPNESSTWVEWGPCPYGAPGARLWVRETWAAGRRFDKVAPRDIPAGSFIWYEATHPGDLHITDCGARGRWRPNIHMPRWASRILLEVLQIRVTRLHDITTGEIWNEGVRIPVSDRGAPLWRLAPSNPAGKLPVHYLPGGAAAARAACSVDDVARAHWADLWDTTNWKRGLGWELNPWVWVIRFQPAGVARG